MVPLSRNDLFWTVCGSHCEHVGRRKGALFNDRVPKRMKLLPTFTAAFALLTLVVADGTISTAHAEPKSVRTISGPASWYGPGFHGRKTANGERFDQNALTAAHRTLPFGTKVRVTCNNTGKTVTVRINDRGPFHGNRVIDLSRGAASKIGIVGSGVGRVKIEVLA